MKFGLAVFMWATLGSFFLPAQQRDLELAQEKLVELEQAAPAAGIHRFYALHRLAETAFDAGRLDKAEKYANELLALAPQYSKDWNYGNAIYYGNMVIGRVALRRDMGFAVAKRSLLAAGKTPGSPQLNSFGPNMSLAKDLLSMGQRDTVLQFFASCHNFWKHERGRLDAWSATVMRGGTPDFGANLRY